MNQEEIREYRNTLINHAKKELKRYPESLYVTLLVLDNGEIITYPLFDLNDEEHEKQFFDNLVKEKTIKFNHVLTMWRNGQIDVPKHSLIIRLKELSEENLDACVLLQGEKGVNGFRLSNLL